jgi:hypothetical protein
MTFVGAVAGLVLDGLALLLLVPMLLLEELAVLDKSGMCGVGVWVLATGVGCVPSLPEKIPVKKLIAAVI